MPPRDQDPLPDPDEPYVRRWPRAVRLVFLIVAATACWILVAFLAWLFWRRLVG